MIPAQFKKDLSKGIGTFVILFIGIVIVDWIEGSGTILETITQWWKSFD